MATKKNTKRAASTKATATPKAKRQPSQARIAKEEAQARALDLVGQVVTKAKAEAVFTKLADAGYLVIRNPHRAGGPFATRKSTKS